MAKITLVPPINDYELPLTGGNVTTESGNTFKKFVTDLNSMFTDLYTSFGPGSNHVTLRGPAEHGWLPNNRDFTAERGDNFQTIVNSINSMFAEIYTLSGAATTNKVTLRGPTTAWYQINTHEFSSEHGDPFRTIINQINLMMTDCYTGGSQAHGVGAAIGIGASIAAAIGSAAGIGAAIGVGATSGSAGVGAGTAAGVGAAIAVGSSIAAGAGSAAGTGAAIGVSPASGGSSSTYYFLGF